MCFLGVEDQPAIVRPPETLSTWPVTKEASSLAKRIAGQVVGPADAASGIERVKAHQLLRIAGALLVVLEQRGRGPGRPR
jgi:hypothetical protein